MVFIEEYEKYLIDLEEYRDLQSKTIVLEIELMNEGSSPAKNIVVQMHFPDGFKLLKEIDFPTEPKEPEPPSRPKGIFALIASGGVNLDYLAMPVVQQPRFFIKEGKSNVTLARLERTNSYDVEFHVEKSRHGFNDAFETLYVVFDTVESVKGFAIGYKIHSDDLATPVEGTLGVAVNAFGQGEGDSGLK